MHTSIQMGMCHVRGQYKCMSSCSSSVLLVTIYGTVHSIGLIVSAIVYVREQWPHFLSSPVRYAFAQRQFHHFQFFVFFILTFFLDGPRHCCCIVHVCNKRMDAPFCNVIFFTLCEYLGLYDVYRPAYVIHIYIVCVCVYERAHKSIALHSQKKRHGIFFLMHCIVN